MITVGRKDKRLSGYFMIHDAIYPTCLEYTAFSASGIYVQSIQSAQIEFNVLNAINVLNMICISCHNICNTCGRLLFIISYTYLSFLFFNKTLCIL